MPISTAILARLTANKKEAIDLTIDRHGVSANYALASEKFEATAAEWIYYIKNASGADAPTQEERYIAYGNVVELYDLARSYLFKATNEKHLAMSTAVCKRMLQLADNTVNMNAQLNPDIKDKVARAKINIAQAYSLLTKGDNNSDWHELEKYLLSNEKILDKAEYVLPDYYDLKRFIYLNTINYLLKQIQTEFKIVNCMKDDFPDIYIKFNFAKINEFDKKIKDLWSLLTPLTEIINKYDLNTPENRMLENCEIMENDLCNASAESAEWQMKLFEANIPVEGIERIEHKSEKSTLRRRFKI